MAFEHTFRILGAMKLRRNASLVLLLVAALSMWVAWLMLGTVSIYVRSERARLEVTQNAFPVQSEVDGIVSTCALFLGGHVEVGDVLVQLDTKPLELQLVEKGASLRGRELALNALRSLLEAETRARDSVSNLVTDTRHVAVARISADERSAAFKKTESDMMKKLRAEALASGLETLRAESEHDAVRKQLALTRQQATLDTTNALTNLRDREARISNLQKTLADAESELSLERARLETLAYEIKRRQVRSRVAGTLSDVVGCTPGMTLDSSTRLASLLPDGEVRVVAYFSPQEAVGRVRSNQPAIIRVDSYPWTQFGILRAKVTQIGSEARDGQVRVELALLPDQDSSIPRMHGLVATAEVQTEILSPGKLLLRLAGQSWNDPPPKPVEGTVPPRATSRQ